MNAVLTLWDWRVDVVLTLWEWRVDVVLTSPPPHGSMHLSGGRGGVLVEAPKFSKFLHGMALVHPGR